MLEVLGRAGDFEHLEEMLDVHSQQDQKQSEMLEERHPGNRLRNT